MNLRDLKYLVAVAEQGHFGKAATACFISQPALSMQIKKLEDMLGVQLLERTNKSVMLTDAGKIICEQAKNILRHENEIYTIAKQARDPFAGDLHMGVIPTIAPYFLPYIIPGLTKTFSKLNLYLFEAQTHQLIQKLKEGKLDIALLALPISDQELVTEPLFEEEFLLAVSQHHPLAKRKTIKYPDLKNLTILLLEDGHCLRDQALMICHQAKASETKSFQATSLETLRHMVASQIGVTLMPKLASKQNDGISYLTFNHPKPIRKIGLVWRTSSARKILLNNLSKEIKKLISSEKQLQASLR